jgi:hypothetical protein
MAKIGRNELCSCGSGRKYKRCCGDPTQIIMPSGVDGLERPEPLLVEPTFNEFVLDFGGELVSDLIENESERPLNADYLFRNYNVIAELKTFGKDLFNTDEDKDRIISIIKKHINTGAVSSDKAFRWLMGQEQIPYEYRRDMLSLARRYIERALIKANKQITSTKDLLSKPDLRGLVLLANNGNYFSDPPEAVLLITQVMQEHFMESSIDGFVYFTVNTVAKIPGNDRELSYWVPSYRKDGDDLAGFVNLLGAKWGDFYSAKIGQEVPRFETEEIRAIKEMRLVRTPQKK